MEALGCEIPLIRPKSQPSSEASVSGAGGQVDKRKLWNENVLRFYIKNSNDLAAVSLNKQNIISWVKNWNPVTHKNIPKLQLTSEETNAHIRIQISQFYV